MNAFDMNAEKAYGKYLDELDKLRSIADKEDFSEAGEAEFQAQRRAASAALDACIAAYRERAQHEDR